MESELIGIGILLAIFGPLLLIPIIWIFYRLFARKIVKRIYKDKFRPATNDVIAIIASTTIVLTVLLISYLPGKMEFNTLCSQHGTPYINNYVQTDSFYRTRLYPYEAKQFLGPEGFDFVEAPHMYNKGSYVKYTLTEAGEINEKEITEPASEYGMRDELILLPLGINLSKKTAYEMSTGKEFAQAATLLYSGGPLSIITGIYGMSSCPDSTTGQGSKHFNTYYQFEKKVLLNNTES